jgi:tRNA (mo5U34)-methyltransferase
MGIASDPGTDRAELERLIAGNHDWYHTIELAPGVLTPGRVDTRPVVSRVPMPASLSGMRCLDIGTWDGFWAFEMERRGAASVVAIDILDEARWDWPPEMRVKDAMFGLDVLSEFKQQGVAFEVAHEIIGSNVERIDMSIYDLSPETIGTFDFVFLGSLLLHLRDPVRALDAMRSVVGDEAVIADTVDLVPSLLRPRTATARLEGVDRPWWWVPNKAGLHQMIRSAGFEILEATPVYFLPTGSKHPPRDLRNVPRKLLSSQGREELVISFKGIPHAAVRARSIGAKAG